MSGRVIKQGFLHYEFGGQIFEGACTRRGVLYGILMYNYFIEFYGMYVFKMYVCF